MAGRMNDPENKARGVHRVALGEPAIRKHGAGVQQAETRARFDKAFQQKQVSLVRTLNRDAKLLPQTRSTARMVDVAVGQKDFFNRHAQLGNCGKDHINITTGIDNHGAF